MKALITGASSGMGKDMANILAESYDEIVLVGRNKERLVDLQNKLSSKKVKVKIIITDLSIKENVLNLYEENKNVDLLINNAGFGDFGKFYETDLEKDISMINTNIVALHLLTKLYLKDMVKNNKGHILNVASVAGFMPGPLMATYYATKNYVVKLSESIYEELRKDGSNVKISILCPGPVATNFEKTANVKFAFKGKNSEYVARYALNHLNKFYIIPGFDIKLTKFWMRLLPSKIAAKIVYNFQKSRKPLK